MLTYQLPVVFELLGTSQSLLESLSCGILPEDFAATVENAANAAGVGIKTVSTSADINVLYICYDDCDIA